MFISKQLKGLREKNGFSQEKLAELLNVSRQTISNWENGKSYPDVHNLILLCDVFSISIDNLIKGDIEKMKQEISSSNNDKSPRDAVEIIHSGWVMLLGFLTMIIGGVVIIAAGNHFWGFAFLIIGFLIAFLSASYADRLKKKNRIKTYKELSDFYDYSMNLLEKSKEE